MKDPQRVEEDRSDSEQSSSFFRVGPVRFDSRISLANVFAIVMAFVAMVGGWYKFDYRVTGTEQEIQAIQAGVAKNDIQIQGALEKHEANDQKLADTLERTNQVMGAVIQALDDHNIHVSNGRFR